MPDFFDDPARVPDPSRFLDPVRKRGRRYRARRAVVGAVALVLVAAGAGTAAASALARPRAASIRVTNRAGGPSPTPAASSSTTLPTPTPTPHPPTTGSASSPAAPSGELLAAGTLGTAAQAPWSQVGPGWFLVLLSATRGHFDLEMVDPSGGRYLMAQPAVAASSGAAPTLLGWSAAGRRALLADSVDGSGYGSVSVVDLTTGHSTPVTFADPDAVTAALLTDPDGLNLLVGTATGSRGTVERTSLTGGVTAVLATRIPLSSSTSSGPAPLSSPDGTEVVFATSRGLGVVSNAGGAVRYIRVSGGCTPVRFWTSSQVLASCAQGPNGTNPLQLVDLTTGAATPLTGPHAYQSQDLDDLNAFQLGSALYTSAARGCGSVGIEHVQPYPSGGATPVQLPVLGPISYLAGVDGHDLVVVTGPRPAHSPVDCAANERLYLINPVSGTATLVVSGLLGVVAVEPGYLTAGSQRL